MKSRILAGASALALLGVAGPTFAQDEAASVSEVVVTGSLIRGTPEDAALPVDVIGAEELSKQGNPTTVELIKALPASQGVLGDSNQFDARAQGSEGIGSINLRGLGAARTLVLVNGRRLAASGFIGAVDTNMIPSNAIGRIEVLKDGAAVTYGSEAIAGVVNFITPTNFEGFQIDGSYTYIDGSDGGDHSIGAKFGHVWDNGNVFATVNYIHRGMLPIYEKDWANQPLENNPEGGWTISNNPGTFIPLLAGGGLPGIFTRYQRDAQCETLGGTPGVVSVVVPICRWRFANWDNLTEPEDRVQFYAEVNAQLAENAKLHVEAMFSKADITMSTSPSYSLINSTTTTTSPYAPNFYVPASNPGLAAYSALHPEQFPDGNQGAILPVPGLFRPMSMGGNPLYGDIGSGHGKRDYELARVVGELSGEFDGGIGYTLSLTYSQAMTYGTQEDTVTSLFQNALKGLGGPNCNPAIGTPGVGDCHYWYPFSTSVEMNRLTGQTNPEYNPALANDPELVRWFYQEVWRRYVNRLFVGEAVLNGEIPAIELPGGKIGWAAGAQYRLVNFNTDLSDNWNLAINPCIDTPVTGNKSCAVKNGPLVFLGGFYEQDLEQTAYALFSELQLPVFDNFNVQLAARYEDYGGDTGSTFDPKVSFRWQIVDALALRGSWGTTFRAPTPATLSGQGTSLQSYFGLFRPVDIIGNPKLEPESATTYSVGAMVRLGGLRATLDYWNYAFDNPIGVDPSGNIVSTFFTPILDADGHPIPGRYVGCEDPSYAALKTRFDFSDGTCTTNFSRLRTYYVNGAEIKTNGFDLLADYDLPWQPLGAEITVGGSATYVLEYSVGDFQVEGVTVQKGFDGVGLLNYQTSLVPVPQWKGQLYADFTLGEQNLRLTLNYIDSYTDQRGCAVFGCVNDDGTTTGNSTTGELEPQGKKIDKTITLDASYRINLPWDTTATLRVANVFDRDPSFARLDLNYDPFTGNPLGRTVKFSLSKKW